MYVTKSQLFQFNQRFKTMQEDNVIEFVNSYTLIQRTKITRLFAVDVAILGIRHQLQFSSATPEGSVLAPQTAISQTR